MRSGTLAALLAAQAAMSAAGFPLVGEMASYNVNPYKVERTVLRDVLSRAGYGPIAKQCIPTHTPVQALGNAISQCKPPRGLAVLPVRQPSDGCLVEFGVWRGNPESKSAGEEKPVMGARVRINANGVAEFLPVEGVDWPLPDLAEDEEYSPEQMAAQACMGHARQLAQRANKLVRFVETNDVTGALQAILQEKMFGSKFSDHGRGHFILAKFAEPWHKLMDLLAPFGVTPVILPIYKDGVGEVTTAAAAKEDFAAKILDLRKALQETANKTGVRGPRADSLDRRVTECLTLINTANMYADILGAMKDAVITDAEKVKNLFVKLQGGGRVTFGAAEVDAPIMGEAQIREEQSDPTPAPGPYTAPDGARVIPSEPAAPAAG